MAVILLKNLFRILFANFRRGRMLKKKRSLFALAGLAVLPVLIFLQTTDMFYNWLLMPNIGQDFLFRFVSASLLGILVLLILTGLPSVLHHFFLAPDLTLLYTLPLKPRDIFLHKFLHATINNLGMFFAIGLPLLISMVVALGASPFVYIVLFFASMLFVFLPTAFAALMAFLLVSLFSAKRIRRVSTFVLGIFIMAMWAGMQVLRLSRLNPALAEYDPTTVSQTAVLLNKLDRISFPSDWLVSAVRATYNADWISLVTNLVLLACVAFLLMVVVVFWRIRLQNRHIRLDAFGQRRHTHHIVSASGAPASLFKTIFLKDTRLILRDTRFFSSSFLLMAMLLLAPLFAGADTTNSAETLSFFVPYMPVTILALIVSSTLARQSLPLERLSFFWLLSAPVSTRRIVFVKLMRVVVWVIPAVLISVVITAFNGDAQASVFALSMIHVGFVFCGASIGLASAAFTTHFDWTDPRYMSSPTGTFLTSLFVLLAGALGGGILMFGFFIGQLIVAFLIFFVYVFFVLWISLRVAHTRLTQLDWIY